MKNHFPRFNVIRFTALGAVAKFLRPDSDASVDETADELLVLLEENENQEYNARQIVREIIRAARDVPYHHVSQVKVVNILDRLLSLTHNQKVFMQAFRETCNARFRIDDEHFSQNFRHTHCYVNDQAFTAKVYDRRIVSANSSRAIWALRYAFEQPNKQEVYENVKDIYISGAAQWILWYGQRLFQSLMFSGEVTRDQLKSWQPGPLYIGKPGLSIHRWRFWQNAFLKVASGHDEGEKGHGEECRSLALRAADIMGALERSMSF